jgi:iron complex transport system substrate-binding protein
MYYLNIFIIAGLSLACSCSFSTNIEYEGSAVSVTDFRGKEVRLPKHAEKVVCLIESSLSGIYMLGKGQNLIAIPSNVYGKNLYGYYSRLDHRIQEKTLPAPGNWDFISIEKIVGLNPDLVIIWASQTEAIENIEQFGIPVYAVMLHSFDDVYQKIADFGELLDCSDRADSLIRITKDNLASIRYKYRNPNPKSVYFMWAQGVTETSGINSTVNELLEIAGTVNACTMEHEHLSVSIEKLYDWNPDMIVMWYNERLDPEDIMADPLLQGLSAVRNKKVYELPDVFACDFWTLKMQYPAQLIGSWAYPDKGDPEHFLNDMYMTLYGKPLQ